MAKKVNLEEDDFDKEIEAVEEAEDVEAVDVEAVEAVEDIGEVEEVEEVEAVDAGEGGSIDEPPVKTRPKGKNSPLTLALCVLNVVAALAFLYFLVLDFHQRQQWSYAVFMNELFVQGLPLKEEDTGLSGSRAVMPHQRLDSKQISEVFSARGGRGGGEFWAVDEAFPNRITPSNLTPEVLKDYFAGIGEPVGTLEAEVERLKAKVPADIVRVAQEAVEAYKAKKDADKRTFAKSILLPLAYNPHQVDSLEQKIMAAKGAGLDALIGDGVQRRLFVDLLAPCEIFRPGDVTTPFLAKVADLEKFKLDDLQALLRKRFEVAIADKFDGAVHLGKDWEGQKRLSWEKRQTIGFLLVDIATMQKPDLVQPDRMVPLYPDAGAPQGTPNLLRAQTVLGLYEFTAAVRNLPLAWQSLERRVLQAIHDDREGFEIGSKEKGFERNQGFIDKYAAEIKRIQDLVLEIRKAEERLKDLQTQSKTAKGIYEYRDQYLKEMVATLKTSREKTNQQVAKLRELQKEIYQAQAVLRDAAERNLRLDQEIKAEERKLRGQTGASTP